MTKTPKPKSKKRPFQLTATELTKLLNALGKALQSTGVDGLASILFDSMSAGGEAGRQHNHLISVAEALPREIVEEYNRRLKKAAGEALSKELAHMAFSEPSYDN